MKITYGDKPIPLPTRPMGLDECLALYGHSAPEGYQAVPAEPAIDDEEETADDQ
jgi:hypothetical protein